MTANYICYSQTFYTPTTSTDIALWILFKTLNTHIHTTWKNKSSKNIITLNQASEKAMAPHSSTLAWKIPWMEEPGRLQSMGSRRVGHDWATSLSLFTFMHWRRKWQPPPVFLPGESQGWWSLIGCRLWGRTELDTTEATWQQQQQWVLGVKREKERGGGKGGNRCKDKPPWKQRKRLQLPLSLAIT